MIKAILFIGLTMGSLFLSQFATGSPATSIRVCFTPQQNCTALLIQQIKQAKKSILVQAYSFTNHKIGDALVAAHKQGVNVKVIADKSNFKRGQRTSMYYLMRHGIPVWDDNKLRIAHNKIMIFDDRIVETGSFNFTYSAQHFNAENMLIINNRKIAKLYEKNWHLRQKQSKRYHDH